MLRFRPRQNGGGGGVGGGDREVTPYLNPSVAGRGHRAEFLGSLSSDALAGLRLNQQHLPKRLAQGSMGSWREGGQWRDNGCSELCCSP